MIAERLVRMRKKFFMVLGAGEPCYRHDSQLSAEREAERLATQNPGQEFVVLESLSVCSHRVVQWEQFGTDEQIEESRNMPF